MLSLNNYRPSLFIVESPYMIQYEGCVRTDGSIDWWDHNRRVGFTTRSVMWFPTDSMNFGFTMKKKPATPPLPVAKEWI